MLFKSALLTAASGKVNGLVASHNKGGNYFRSLTIPTNPNSTFQQTVRNAMSQLSNLWSNTLTSSQRDLWDYYAFNVPVVNALGDPINLSGFNMYVRSNVPRLQTGEPRVDTGPTTFNLGDFTSPTFALDEPNDEVDVSFDNTDAWANEDDAAMLVYCSRPQALTVNFFKGPYRLAGVIQGDSLAAPASPAAITLPFPVATGQRIFVKLSVSRADGRLSAPFRGSADA